MAVVVAADVGVEAEAMKGVRLVRIGRSGWRRTRGRDPTGPCRNDGMAHGHGSALAAAGLDASHCVEREDLEALYGTVGKRPRIEITEEREEDEDDSPSASSFDLFDSLPTEVNELILRELSPRSLAAATGVSRAWRDAAGDDELWAAHLARAPRFSKNEKPVPFPSTSARHSSRRGRRELMRTYAAARELGCRWRDGKYARCERDRVLGRALLKSRGGMSPSRPQGAR